MSPNPPSRQAKETPLHAAACWGHASIVTLLLVTPGVDPMARDEVRGVHARQKGLKIRKISFDAPPLRPHRRVT